MHISREIRRKLEGSLPSYVLEYLTEKFTEAEEYCNKAKQLESKIATLENQLRLKDQLLFRMSQGNRGYNQLGYNYSQRNTPKSRYWEDSQQNEYPSEVPDITYARGKSGRGNDGRSNTGQDNSSSGQSTSAAFVPNVEPTRRKIYPVYEMPPNDYSEVKSKSNDITQST